MTYVVHGLIWYLSVVPFKSQTTPWENTICWFYYFFPWYFIIPKLVLLFRTPPLPSLNLLVWFNVCLPSEFFFRAKTKCVWYKKKYIIPRRTERANNIPVITKDVSMGVNLPQNHHPPGEGSPVDPPADGAASEDVTFHSMTSQFHCRTQCPVGKTFKRMFQYCIHGYDHMIHRSGHINW